MDENLRKHLKLRILVLDLLDSNVPSPIEKQWGLGSRGISVVQFSSASCCVTFILKFGPLLLSRKSIWNILKVHYSWILIHTWSMVICSIILDSVPFLSTQTKMDSFPVLSLILHLDSFPFQFLSISKIQKKLSKIFPNSSKILRFHYRCLKCLLGNPCGLSQGKLFPISYENLRLLVLRYWSRKHFKAKIQAFFKPEEEFFK